jgi:hypothetical protein
MGRRKNELGFSIVEALLILVAVSILLFTAWYVYHARKVANKNYATQASEQSETSSGYAGWKTYYFTVGKFSLKYPSNWTLGASEESIGVSQVESATLMGPHNFTLNYSLDKANPADTIAAIKQQETSIGNPDPAVSDAYNVIGSFKPANYPTPLYVVYNTENYNDPGGPLNYIELSAYTSYLSQPLGYPAYYPSSVDSGDVASWFGGYGKLQGGPIGMLTTTFLAKPEVKTAILILKSISYKAGQ